MSLDIPQPWRFDHAVAHVFAEHVRQSIPDYDEMYRLFRSIIHQWHDGPSVFLDLGTGTAEALAALAPEWRNGDSFIGVDSSEAMLARARETCSGLQVEPQFIAADLRSFDVPAFDVGILTFTLSFIEPAERHALLERILKSASPSGVLLFADKIRYTRPMVSSAVAQDHTSFKRRSGISEEDVRAKAASLRGVQKPWELETYLDSLRSAGWRDPQVVHLATGFFACVAFAGDENAHF